MPYYHGPIRQQLHATVTPQHHELVRISCYFDQIHNSGSLWRPLFSRNSTSFVHFSHPGKVKTIARHICLVWYLRLFKQRCRAAHEIADVVLICFWCSAVRCVPHFTIWLYLIFYKRSEKNTICYRFFLLVVKSVADRWLLFRLNVVLLFVFSPSVSSILVCDETPRVSFWFVVSNDSQLVSAEDVEKAVRCSNSHIGRCRGASAGKAGIRQLSVQSQNKCLRTS